MVTSKHAVTAYIEQDLYDRILGYCRDNNLTRRYKGSNDLVPNVSKAIEFKLKESFGLDPVRKELTEIKSRLDQVEIAVVEEGIMYFDGGSRGNPGLSAGGACLTVGTQVFEEGEILEFATNNEAEYLGLIVGLKKAKELGLKKLKVFGDSLLIINHVQGNWYCRQPHLQSLLKEVTELLNHFESCELEWVKRDKNGKADAVCNRLMDKHLGLVDKSKQKDKEYSGAIASQILSKLNQCSRSFKEMAQLKAGRDQFSSKKLSDLSDLLTFEEIDTIEQEWLLRDNKLPDDKHLAIVYRWYLRGKPLIKSDGMTENAIANFACHKVRVDMEIANNIINKTEKL